MRSTVSGNSPPYHEELLHWIWKSRRFDYQNLITGNGQKVTIRNTGEPNKSDGPDFLNAEIVIGSLTWHGDVEIHWNLSDWKAHHHHTDPNYDRVILHVIFERNDNVIYRSDHSPVPTLSLAPYITKPLQLFLKQYLRSPKLPCSGRLSFISEEAFNRQIQKAHKEYFEQKVDDLLAFYDPKLVPSAAWLKMFTVALFDGLGISHNRRPMRWLAGALFPIANKDCTLSELRNKAIELSRINNRDDNPRWKHKGMRPANHPLPRIKQGAELLWHIKTVPFTHWMNKPPDVLWQHLVDGITTTPSLGRQRADILFGTVFLPALYSLGNLFFSEKLKSSSWELWKDHRVSLPASLLRLFEEADLPPSSYDRKLGAIYQLRTYCRPGNCQNCKVFKSAISS